MSLRHDAPLTSIRSPKPEAHPPDGGDKASRIARAPGRGSKRSRAETRAMPCAHYQCDRELWTLSLFVTRRKFLRNPNPTFTERCTFIRQAKPIATSRKKIRD